MVSCVFRFFITMHRICREKRSLFLRKFIICFVTIAQFSISIQRATRREERKNRERQTHVISRTPQPFDPLSLPDPDPVYGCYCTVAYFRTFLYSHLLYVLTLFSCQFRTFEKISFIGGRFPKKSSQFRDFRHTFDFPIFAINCFLQESQTLKNIFINIILRHFSKHENKIHVAENFSLKD